MTETLAVQNLSIGFQTPSRLLPAVDALSFQLHPGETLALLGESGCGKSITALSLMRLLPPEAGFGEKSSIRLNQTELLDLPEAMMRAIRGQRLAMIFQEPMTALNPVLTIGEQVVEAILAHQVMRRRVAKQRALDLLQEVELPNPEQRYQQYPHQLSGGQKQRVVIAMALARNPTVLIADEPTTALDVTIQAQILALLKKLQQAHQMCVLFITHDLGVVHAVADRVCVMYAGQIVELATVPDFFAKPLAPYSQQLLVSQPSFAARGKLLQTIPGSVPSLDAMPTGCRFHPRCAHAFEPCEALEPALQSMGETRQVRCHLYPGHDRPPALPSSDALWGEREIDDTPFLTIEHLSVTFPVPHPLFHRGEKVIKAVDDVSLSLGKGRTLALVGESGCGKTTLARALLRLQPIQAGSIVYRGRDVSKLKGAALRQFRQQVQIIFQDPYTSMNPRMTVRDILAEGMSNQGLASKVIDKKLKTLLEHVNLPSSSLARYPHQFSGGQRQRICIARALAVSPDVIVCDEPTSALDISVQAQILNLLKQLQVEFGLTYLFITHNMQVVAYLADDVAVMQGGKLVEEGPCETLFAEPKHPYTKHLLASVLGA